MVNDFIKGETNKVQSIIGTPGGKGINVSRTLLKFGIDSLAIGIASNDFINAVSAEGIDNDFVLSENTTRTNIKIVDSSQGITTELNEPGQPVSFELLNDVRERLEQHLSKDDIVIFSGSLPPGTPNDIYREWIELCRSKGVITILDTSGLALFE
jgi:1-phosphofructokinase